MKRPSFVTMLAGAFGLVMVGCASDTPVAPDSPPAFRHVAGIATARATLHVMNQSGVHARISFTDDGSTLTINGTASGLVPSVPYASLIYDNGSVSGGPEGCEPTIFDPTDPDFLLPTMFVGIWMNHGDGTGTLAAVNTNGGVDYVPLGKFRTISVRDLTINEGFGPEAVAACGEVAEHPAG